MSAHLKTTVHANFKDICRAQEAKRKKELGSKSIIDSEKRVFKIIAAIKDYENPFAFSSTRKSELNNIVTGSVARLEYLSDILKAFSSGSSLLYDMNFSPD